MNNDLTYLSAEQLVVRPRTNVQIPNQVVVRQSTTLAMADYDSDGDCEMTRVDYSSGSEGSSLTRNQKQMVNA